MRPKVRESGDRVSLQIKNADGQVRSFELDEEGRTIDPYDQWEAEFKPLLGSTPRWEGFSYIVKDLLARDSMKLEKPAILETGTLRQSGNWAGDGQSTKIWDWVVRHTHGRAVSVDSSKEACAMARKECSRVWVMCEDSVSYLRNMGGIKLDLLYLDSYDYSPGQELNACMHQVAELSSIWERLPSGCLIASDDSHSPDAGKPVLTRRLLHMLGVEPLLDSYIVIWKKP